VVKEATMNWPWRQLRSAVASIVPAVAAPTPEERAAKMKAEREAARKREAEEWAQHQAAEHAALIEEAAADLAMQRRIAETTGWFDPREHGRGGIHEIKLADGESIDLSVFRRGPFGR
jgi:hypothetical protein